MENDILVSVIMSEYNTDEKLLKEAIKSILEQTYKNLEIIIIDDNGKNDVQKVAEEFNDNRIRVLKNDKNQGLVFSLNRAINESRGKYLIRMDTDDYSYRDRIEKQVKFMEEHSEYAVAGGRADYYNGSEIFAESKFFGEVTKSILSKGPAIIHPTVIMRKDIIEKVGGYQNYNRCEDYALWIELALNGYKMYVIDEKVLRYHLSLSDYSKRKLSTRKGFFKLLKEKYRKLNPSITSYWLLVIKTFVAGIMPYKLMANYHKHKYKIKE